MTDDPDIRTVITGPTGTYYVDLWRGLFRDRIIVWKDVRPALGGTMWYKRLRHRDTEAAYNGAVEAMGGPSRPTMLSKS